MDTNANAALDATNAGEPASTLDREPAWASYAYPRDAECAETDTSAADLSARDTSARDLSPPHAPMPLLGGRDAPVAGSGPLAIAEALLRSPASVLHDVRHGRGALLALAALVLTTMLVTGLVMATFGGGLQLVLVPLKLALGVFFCAIICLPSLYVLSCLSGASQSLRETWGALLMGVALMGLLLVGFAPVVWVFSQATSSPAFMGTLHLAFLGISVAFGVGLVRRALSALNGAPVRGVGLWSVLFVLVLLQMTTTLRPLVGPFDGTIVGERTFFVAHWLSSLG